jgi:membrane protein implicated in regulation of membrane protease activity
MAAFYLGLFIIGVGLTAVTVLTGIAGHTFGHGHGDAGDVGHGGPDGHGADSGQGSGGALGHLLSVVNFGTATAFLTWFGGIGYLMTAYSHVVALATVAVSMIGGVAGAGFVLVFMRKVLVRDQIPLRAADYYMPGTLGRVSVRIPPKGTGEIVYTQGGARKTAAARGDDGQEIGRGTEVVVLSYERGIANVRPWDQLAERRTATRPADHA